MLFRSSLSSNSRYGIQNPRFSNHFPGSACVQKKRQFIHKKNFVEVIYRKSNKGQEKQMASTESESRETGSKEQSD